jgi:beta-N-acetylhexosaminidase
MAPDTRRRHGFLLPIARGFCFLAAAALACLSLAGSAPSAPDFWAAGGPREAQPARGASARAADARTPIGTEAEAALAQSLISRMGDEQVLAQILMMAYPGDAPGELLQRWIRERGLGGVKIFGWNAEDSRAAASAVAVIQEAALSSGAGIPLLVATDQEGGWIRHIKGDTTETPGNMAIGASGRPYDAYRSGELIGRELAALGVNMNFAPSVDLATEPRSYIIGPRAFSDDPAAAAALGAAYAGGLAAAGVIATAKHYPGHGATAEDSHGSLPVIRIDEKTLWNRELLPFRVLAAQGIPAIMCGHLAFPLVSGNGTPASLSRYFMTTLLRERIGFKGIAVTDDLAMNGASAAAGSFPEACVEAVEAGNDVIMMSRLLEFDDPAWGRLLEAYRGKPAFRARVRDSAARVLETKLRYLKPRGKAALVPDLARLGSRVPDPEAAAFFKEQAYRSATAVASRGIPFAPAGRVLVASPLKDFAAAALEAFPGAASFRFSYAPEGAAQAGELASFDAALAGCSAAVVCVANQAGMDFAQRAHDAGKAVAIVSAQSPAPLARAAWAEAAVAVYACSPQSLRAGIDVLTGKAAAQGRLPVKLGR